MLKSDTDGDKLDDGLEKRARNPSKRRGYRQGRANEVLKMADRIALNPVKGPIVSGGVN